MVDQVYVVQFPHPGREHRPDKNDRKAWTRCEDGHGRLFVEQPGDRDAALAPLFSGAGCAEDDRELRLYEAATFDNAVEGMFGFFPCLPADESHGFPRPKLRLPGIVNPSLAMGLKIGDSVEIATAKNRWQDVVDQVLNAGLCLGVRADMPAYSEKGNTNRR